MFGSKSGGLSSNSTFAFRTISSFLRPRSSFLFAVLDSANLPLSIYFVDLDAPVFLWCFRREEKQRTKLLPFIRLSESDSEGGESLSIIVVFVFCFLFLFICFVGMKQFVPAKLTKTLPASVLSLTFCGSQRKTNHDKGSLTSMFRFTTINHKYIPSTTLEDNTSSDSNSSTDELAGEIVGVGGERGARRRRWQRRIRRRRLSLSLPA